MGSSAIAISVLISEDKTEDLWDQPVSHFNAHMDRLVSLGILMAFSYQRTTCERTTVVTSLPLPLVSLTSSTVLWDYLTQSTVVLNEPAHSRVVSVSQGLYDGILSRTL